MVTSLKLPKRQRWLGIQYHILLLCCYAVSSEGIESVLFRNTRDAFAHDTDYATTIPPENYTLGEAETISCLRIHNVHSVAESVENGDEDYIHMKTTPWHSVELNFDCKEKDTNIYNNNWKCTKSCYGPTPTFLDYPYLTFKAKYDGASNCPPKIGIQKRWPMYSSKSIELAGKYVDGGSLLPNDWRQVVIPTVDFVDYMHSYCNDPTDTSTCSCTDVNDENTCTCLDPTTSCTLYWPDLKETKSMWFKTCGQVSEYFIADMKFTDTPPVIEEAALAVPSMNPSVEPSLAPTDSHSSSPSRFPTISPTKPTKSIIFQNVQDAFARDTSYALTIPPEYYTVGEAGTTSCLRIHNVNSIAEAVHNDDGDFLHLKTTPWHSVELNFDCKEKDTNIYNNNWKCTKSCFGPTPTFLDYPYLTFKAKYDGVSECPPTIAIQKRWPMYNSRIIELSGAYVDDGSLTPNEWRQVVIPTADFVDLTHTYCNDPTDSSTCSCTDTNNIETCECLDPNDRTTCSLYWPNLEETKSLWFRTCGQYASDYFVKDIQLTESPPMVKQPNESFIFQRVQDAFAHDTDYALTIPPEYYTVGEAEAMSCIRALNGNSIAEAVENGDEDYIHMKTTPWHSVELNFDCKEKDTNIYNNNWKCTKSCYGPTPTFLDYPYLTFKAKYDGASNCPPKIGIQKRWPMYSSKSIELAGKYVDGGSLLPNDWRQVVIPTVDFVDYMHSYCNDPTDTSTCSCTDVNDENTCTCLDPTTSCTLYWPDLKETKSMWFKTCGQVSEYFIADMKFTDTPPVIEEVVFVPPSMLPSMNPSAEPSLAPTDSHSSSPTGNPSKLPTPSPTTHHHGHEIRIPSGQTVLQISQVDQLFTLTKAHVDNTTGVISHIVPIARSYNGHNWEASPGDFATDFFRVQTLTCTNDDNKTCVVVLPSLGFEESYLLSTYEYSLQERDEIARFLEKTTFGPTPSELNAWVAQPGAMHDKMVSWIELQMDAALTRTTSHREYFRTRVNSRLAQSRRAARANHACNANSRWRKFAFSGKDAIYYTPYSLRISGKGPYIIYYADHPRVVVPNITFTDGTTNYQFNDTFQYRFCGITERVGGNVGIYLEDGSCKKFPNPSIEFGSGFEELPEFVLDLPDDPEVLRSIDEAQSEEDDLHILLSELNSTSCDEVPEVVEEGDAPVFGRLPNGTWLIHDPHVLLETNTLDDFIVDGGGATQLATGGLTWCSNVPRTFANEHSCAISEAASACGSTTMKETYIKLDQENIRNLQTLSGRYVYSVLGLRVTSLEPVCTPELKLRWEVQDSTPCNPTLLGTKTSSILFDLFDASTDTNLNLRDFYFPNQGNLCNESDTMVTAVEIEIDGVCWKRVHPAHKGVYDLTYWTREDTHPGNMHAAMHEHPHPIKKWADLYESAFLTYPSSHPIDGTFDHPISRWDNNYESFHYLGRLGDSLRYRDLPNELRLDQVADYYNATGSSGGSGVVVCGSDGEVKNDPTLGSVFKLSAQKDPSYLNGWQKQYVWTMVALKGSDQLRQRVAWALSQIFILAKPSVGNWYENSEAFLEYYDIFVKEAFGSYKDILRRISYNALMAENLSYLESRSSAYMWERFGQIAYADENFAREIMQLFSTGIVELNVDGSTKLDNDGNTIQVYTNEDIMSFARAWTGFKRQSQRGNIEEVSWTANRVDPMQIEADWRDRFPKTDLNGGYIGDKHPLCSDLPRQMFLRRGARYRLLGSSSMPELMPEQSSNVIKLTLNDTSLLREQLCSEDALGRCRYFSLVSLASNLECRGSECSVDTVRVVQVADNVFYEYVRPSCVEMSFYEDARKVMGKYGHKEIACANPILPVASEACCESGSTTAIRKSVYDGERMTFNTATNRCSSLGRENCDYGILSTDPENAHSNYNIGTHWTTASCNIQAKVNPNGYVAIVHQPTDAHEDSWTPKHIRLDTRNYFKVYWDNDEYPKVENNCGDGGCMPLLEGECLCNTTVSQDPVFNTTPENVNVVLSSLFIGAPDPNTFDSGTYTSTAHGSSGITTHTINGMLDINTVFEVQDDFGRTFFLKNSRERVSVEGVNSFRNAPHFMSLLRDETTELDAQQETEATLDAYFYHPNTAPFVALRLIQRLVTSNPSPRYMETVANAFRTGLYMANSHSFGNGQYGDLSATVAALLLDREAQTVALDADPSRGSLREPILKVIGLMRSMEFTSLPKYPAIRLLHMDQEIGQMSHASPTVFSFFLPEYKPHGRVEEATLVGPEALILDMPKTVGLLNGLFSMIKYGLAPCYNGFTSGHGGGCTEGTYQRATGILEYARDSMESTERRLQLSESIVDDLATLLTAGRLSQENRLIIKEAFNAASDPESGLRIAQQLLVSSAEFHSTNIVRKSGVKRNLSPPPSASETPYKAVVFINFAGGADSYNILVPHTCGHKDMYTEYAAVRAEVALLKSSLLPINASGQICEQFGIHPSLASVHELYNNNDLLFFANTGVMTQPVTKEDYSRLTKTQLFAHNLMTRESQRLDPYNLEIGTGILGRMSDKLTRSGYHVGSFSIDKSSICLVGEPRVSPSPNIIGRKGVTKFNEAPSMPDMLDKIAALNEATTADSGFFAETWSDSLLQSLAKNDLFHSQLNGKSTSTPFPTTGLGAKLSMITKLIGTRNERGADRDMFFVELPGFDTHANVGSGLQHRLNEANGAIAAFVAELKTMGVWDSVTTFQSSEFARTLAPNSGNGTDHAWGGNYMMFGGNVQGGQIVGQYPDDLTDESPLSMGRGRLIPTTPFDAGFQAIAEWVGVPESDMNQICPNCYKFASHQIFHEGDLFDGP